TLLFVNSFSLCRRALCRRISFCLACLRCVSSNSFGVSTIAKVVVQLDHINWESYLDGKSSLIMKKRYITFFTYPMRSRNPECAQQQLRNQTVVVLQNVLPSQR